MDSLTQITLGAAMGEAVAGKKLGNKAMLWGAIAGTIPDLDVLSNLFVDDDVWKLAFHRGISHSLLFSLVAPFILAWILHRFYDSGVHHKKGYKLFSKVMWLLVLVPLAMGLLYFLYINFSMSLLLIFSPLLAVNALWINRVIKPNFSSTFENISYKRWYLFFFLGVLTHWIIDTFTTYGTQVLQPFSNIRLTTSNISVVDPLYTIPFLICLIVASFKERTDPLRKKWNWYGIAISSFYMLLTFVHKIEVNHQFEKRLMSENVTVNKYMTNPTIFNNILWHGIAETDSFYFEGYYSKFDKVRPFDELRKTPKNSELRKASGCAESYAANTLAWFSDGYYQTDLINDDYYHNDLRFGNMWSDDPNEKPRQVFYFKFDPTDCSAEEIRDIPKNPNKELFEPLWARIKGRQSGAVDN